MFFFSVVKLVDLFNFLFSMLEKNNCCLLPCCSRNRYRSFSKMCFRKLFILVCRDFVKTADEIERNRQSTIRFCLILFYFKYIFLSFVVVVVIVFFKFLFNNFKMNVNQKCFECFLYLGRVKMIVKIICAF